MIIIIIVPLIMELCAQVSAVCLSDLGLCKLAHLDQLPNLRWLSLANNALASLEVDSMLISELTISPH